MRKILSIMALFMLPMTFAFSQTATYHKIVLDGVSGSLVKMGEDGKLAEVNVDELRGKKYLFVYFSAHWCPPCRVFTPKLVDFYKKNVSNGDFELIFVSADRSEEAMLEYMKWGKMPWTAVKWQSPSMNALMKYAGRGIPSLALLDEKDEVLANSEVNGQYLGPDVALKEYLKLKGKK